MADFSDLSLEALRKSYREGGSPRSLVDTLRQRIERAKGSNSWIYVEQKGNLEVAVARIEKRRAAGENLPLFGVPFSVKDNIDVAGMPTTAACPDFSYVAERSARSVELLLAAGALCIGKNNLDQFATGLCGFRSPYGACGSVGNPMYISGGSSSGSAVAVAAGHVSFSIGTDTGGSGRVPAGFNGIVGIKPTVGRISTRGLLPNCPSIDCPCIFANTVDDGSRILEIIDGFDPEDPFARQPPPASEPVIGEQAIAFNFGRLNSEQVETFGMPECATLYEQACKKLQHIGGTPTDIDIAPFIEAGRMLFDGPWISERRASVGWFVDSHPASLFEVTRNVLSSSDRFSAVDTFSAMHRLARLRQTIDFQFSGISAFVVPTAPRAITIEAMAESPIELNNQLGYYSYFANLVDLCGVAVPNAVLSCGVPMGVTFLAPAWQDRPLAVLAKRFESETTAGQIH
jgi:allophanate hydrolase